MERVMEMRGMRRQEIIDYFKSIGGIDNGQGKFIGQGWEVEVKPEKRASLGSIKVPSTIVKFQSDKELLENLINEFRLNFLKAGG